MSFDFGIFGDAALSESFVQWLIEEVLPGRSARCSRLWDYYRNPMIDNVRPAAPDGTEAESARYYIQAQEMGLPARITGQVFDAQTGITARRSAADLQRKEVVIENDIAWRINAMVDFLFGKGVTLLSRASEAARRRDIEAIITAVFEANGGAGFFQDLAVLGAVYGFADCIVRPGGRLNERLQRPSPGRPVPQDVSNPSFHSVLTMASMIALDLIEAPRALPILEEDDYRQIRYYVQHFTQCKNQTADDAGFLNRFFRGRAGGARQRQVEITEILGPHAWQRYEDRRPTAEGPNPLGFVPVVHMQNLAQPYFYEGLSDVEQLVGLQDELNTRLSDRASRITMQAFRMYLAKGIEPMGEKPVSPGRMWYTDNEQAAIEEFGGDGACPSENLHITEIRDAMDKVSGVTPVVAGVLKNKLGNLTSGVALKMTFMGMLTRNGRKQFTYGKGLRQIARMILDILDRAGVFPTDPDERDIEVHFPNPLPEDMTERLKEAQIKKDLGLSQEKILEELGYDIR